MKKIFNINDYSSRYVMHCDTKEKAEVFLKYLDALGEKWVEGQLYIEDTNWSRFGEDTCYAFKLNQYCNIDFYTEKNYMILEFDNFYWARDSLIVDIEQFGNVVISQVIKQDDNIRGDGLLFEHNGIELASCVRPALAPDRIFIRGTRKISDHNVGHIGFDNEEEAREYAEKYKECIRLYNEQVRNLISLDKPKKVTTMVVEVEMPLNKPSANCYYLAKSIDIKDDEIIIDLIEIHESL